MTDSLHVTSLLVLSSSVIRDLFLFAIFQLPNVSRLENDAF